jgi:hypothetical protein
MAEGRNVQGMYYLCLYNALGDNLSVGKNTCMP